MKINTHTDIKTQSLKIHVIINLNRKEYSIIMFLKLEIFVHIKIVVLGAISDTVTL